MTALRGLRQTSCLDSFLAIGRDELDKSWWTLQSPRWLTLLDELEGARMQLFSAAPASSCSDSPLTTLSNAANTHSHVAEMLYSRALTHYFAVYRTCVSLVPLPLSRWRDWYAGLREMIACMESIYTEIDTISTMPGTHEMRVPDTLKHPRAYTTWMMEYEALYLTHFWGTRYAAELRLTQLLQHDLQNNTTKQVEGPERKVQHVTESRHDDTPQSVLNLVIADRDNTMHDANDAGAGETASTMDRVSQFTRRHFVLLHGFNALAYDTQHLFDQYGVVGYTERQILGRLLVGEATAEKEYSDRPGTDDNMTDNNNATTDDEMAAEAVIRQTFRRDMIVPSSALLCSALQQEYSDFEVDESKARQVRGLCESTQHSAWYRAAEALYQHANDRKDDDINMAQSFSANNDNDGTIRETLLDNLARALAPPPSHNLKTMPPLSSARMSRTAMAFAHYRLIELEHFPGVLNPSRMEYVLHLLHRWFEQYVARAHRWSVQDDYVDDTDADLWAFVLERHEVLLRWGLQSSHSIAMHGNDTASESSCHRARQRGCMDDRCACENDYSRHAERQPQHEQRNCEHRDHSSNDSGKEACMPGNNMRRMSADALHRQVEVLRTIAFSVLHAGQLYLSGLMRARAAPAKMAMRMAATRQATEQWVQTRLIDLYARALLNDLNDLLHDGNEDDSDSISSSSSMNSRVGANEGDVGDDEAESEKKIDTNSRNSRAGDTVDWEMRIVSVELESRLKLIVTDAVMLAPGGSTHCVRVQTRNRLLPMVSSVLDLFTSCSSICTTNFKLCHALSALAQVAVRMMHRLEQTHISLADTQPPPPALQETQSSIPLLSASPPCEFAVSTHTNSIVLSQPIEGSAPDHGSEPCTQNHLPPTISNMAPITASASQPSHCPCNPSTRRADTREDKQLIQTQHIPRDCSHMGRDTHKPSSGSRTYAASSEAAERDFALLMSALYADLLRHVTAALSSTLADATASAAHSTPANVGMPSYDTPSEETPRSGGACGDVPLQGVHDTRAHLAALRNTTSSLVEWISDGWARCVRWGVGEGDGGDTDMLLHSPRCHAHALGCSAVYHPRVAPPARALSVYGVSAAHSRRWGRRCSWMDGCCERRRALRRLSASSRCSFAARGERADEQSAKRARSDDA